MSDRRIYLGMPSYGKETNQAGRSFWRACSDMTHVINGSQPGSLLASNFNVLWCDALNRVHRDGERIDYFAMLHDDIGVGEGWLDVLIDELEARQLDVLGVVVPIKDGRGLSSCAVDHNVNYDFESWLASCGINAVQLRSEQRQQLVFAYGALFQRTYDWRPFCRLSMYDVFQLPETFTSEDIGRKLLLNTGCWVCKFDMKWATQVHFEINDRIAFDAKENRYHAQVEPEDWYFSRQCHELGLKIGATRKLHVQHRGDCDFGNVVAWGRNAFDVEYTDKSPVPGAFPFEIVGWLTEKEGKSLAELSRGKRVLEIGSYCGRSTVCMARTAEHVTAVDYFDGRGTPHPGDTLQSFKGNMIRYGVAHKVIAIHPNLSALPLAEYDMAFIDGAHDSDSVRADIEKCRELLAPEGVLVFHDYHSHFDPGVTQAVDELLADGGELLSTHETLAVVKPPALIPLEV